VIQYSQYDNLLKQARRSAKYWIPQLCLALKEENSNNLSNEDTRGRVMKNCISIWQKEDTIRDALPDAIKEKYGKRKRIHRYLLKNIDSLTFNPWDFIITNVTATSPLHRSQ